MITVRFPTGFSIQYNDLKHADFRANGIYLSKTAGDNSYSVWVPIDCVIEHVTPCRTYNASREASDSLLAVQIEALRREVRSLTRKVGKTK